MITSESFWEVTEFLQDDYILALWIGCRVNSFPESDIPPNDRLIRPAPRWTIAYELSSGGKGRYVPKICDLCGTGR